MSIITNFINGLKKSFNGKDYLRDINQCEICGRPSFMPTCLYCSTKAAYRKSEEESKRKEQKW